MDGARFILAGSLIDGSGSGVQRDVFLAVKNGTIADIDSIAWLPLAEGEAIHDFSHHIILPALVDCSVVLSRSPSVDTPTRLSSEGAGPAEKAAMLGRHIRYCHAHGVLGVAEGDEIAGLMEHHRRGAEGESLIDIRTPCLPYLGKEGAPSDQLAGGDFLKIPSSANIEDEGRPYPWLDREVLRRVLQNRCGKKAVVVANGAEHVGAAIEFGCDAIEQGYGMGEDNLRKMAEKGVLWIPSVLRAKNALVSAGAGGDVCCRFSQRYVAPGKPVPGAEAFWKKILSEQLAQLRLARELGVTTAVGTGAGSIGILHGEAMVEEMKLFIKAGYSLEETIRCASENGASFFGMDKLGMLAVGKKATFLIARGTAQQLPRKLSYLEGIYVDGAPSAAYQKNPVMPGR